MRDASRTTAAPYTILYLIDHFHEAGGTEKHLAQLTARIDRTRFRPLVLVFDLGDNELVRQMREDGVTVVDFPVGRYYTPRAAAKAVALARLIGHEGVDLVQTFHFKSDTYGAAVARLAGAPRIVSSRRDLGDLKSAWHRFLSRRINRLFDGFVVVADAVGREVAVREGVAPARMRTIYNGVDAERYRPPTDEQVRRARERFGLRPGDFVVGTAAWFRPEKDHRLLVEALEILANELPALRLLWAGGGPLVEQLRGEVRGRGLDGRVVFAGPLRDVRECLRCCDAASIVPSGNEGFSNSVIEKMAMGLPMLVTDVGGNAEAVIDGVNGFVVAPRDARGLAARLAELARSPEARKQMGIRSRERVESLFSLEAMVRRHEEYYEDLLSGPRRPRARRSPRGRSEEGAA